MGRTLMPLSLYRSSDWGAHLQAGVRYAAKNPYSYVHANVVGHVTLLETIVAQRPLPRLVYASSSSVYGLNTKQPFAEGDRVDNPASLYASTKRVRPPWSAAGAPALERSPKGALLAVHLRPHPSLYCWGVRPATSALWLRASTYPASPLPRQSASDY